MILETYIDAGVYQRLTKSVNQLNLQINRITKDGSKIIDHSKEILPVLENLYDKYYIPESRQKIDDNTDDPIIVTSETFE